MRTKKKTLRRIGRAVCGLALACLTGTAFAAGSPQNEIRLLGESLNPATSVKQVTDRALAAQEQEARLRGLIRIHALVQLRDIPDESQRNDLARGGLELGAYVPNNAWIVTIPVGQATAVARRSDVRWIEPWTADHKLHPRLAKGEIASWSRDPEQPGWITVMVLLHEDVDLDRGDALAKSVGGLAGEPVEGLHGLPVRIPANRLAKLAAEEEVLWIEQSPPPLSETNDGVRTQMKVNAVNGSPYDLDGDGVRLLIFDGGSVRGSHDSFTDLTGSRVTVIDNSAPGAHATHVAGTAAGDGSGSPGLRGRGVAPAAEIFTAAYEQFFGSLFRSSSGDLEADYATARNSNFVDLANNSLGSNIAANGSDCTWEGDYATTSTLLDKIVRGDDAAVTGPVISIWANGNERSGNVPNSAGGGRCGANYRTTGEPACAKNPIQVGAVNSDGSSMTPFSSWGPCDDGRLKPTIVAPGCESSRVTGEGFIFSAACNADPRVKGAACSSNTLYAGEGYCGTSMAAPAVSGAISLLLQDWRDHQTGRANGRLLPALVKAALIQTARDLGAEGPDYRYGYGAVDAQALIDFERAAGITNSLGSASLKAWGTDTLTHGLSDTYTLTVPNGIVELKASLAWDDAAAAPFAATALVNDLDLELQAPDGTIYYPFVLEPVTPHLPAATTVANHLDNQEQVLVKNPQAGVWTVRVRGTSVPQGPQTYGLVYGATPLAFSSCVTTTSDFEAGNDSWALSGGAARVGAPGIGGHGAYSIKLGGGTSQTSEAKRTFPLPLRQRSTWSFYLHMTTTEGADLWGWDSFTAEVRDTNGTVLSVVNFHNDGDVQSLWLPERNIDLTPFAGQTVDLVFRAANDPVNPTTFWVDDVQVTSCPSVGNVELLTFTSEGGEDGHVIESSETSSVGGTAIPNNTAPPGPATFLVGDTALDQQIKGFLSFNTASLPDNAVLVSARLVLNRSFLDGVNPFSTHGLCRVEVKSGAFNSPTLDATDFQSSLSGLPATILSNPTVNGSFAYATFDPAGLAAINRTGTTQIRIAFAQGDNDDLASDVLYFVAGEDATAALRPRLEVRYLP